MPWVVAVVAKSRSKVATTDGAIWMTMLHKRCPDLHPTYSPSRLRARRDISARECGYLADASVGESTVKQRPASKHYNGVSGQDPTAHQQSLTTSLSPVDFIGPQFDDAEGESQKCRMVVSGTTCQCEIGMSQR
jgi:hypothetical protein